MTKSPPGAPVLTRRLSGLQGLVNAVTSVGVKVIPWVPPGAARVLSGGRSVIIDGNTLDPTLQLMLSGLHAVGIDGLAIDDDVAVSRAQMREQACRSSGFCDTAWNMKGRATRWPSRMPVSISAFSLSNPAQSAPYIFMCRISPRA